MKAGRRGSSKARSSKGSGLGSHILHMCTVTQLVSNTRSALSRIGEADEDGITRMTSLSHT